MTRDVLIVSDTHGSATRLEELIRRRQSLLGDGEPSVIIFLGDGTEDLFSCRYYDKVISYAVRGNCDTGSWARFSPEGEEIPLQRLITLGKHRVFMTHGHAYSVKSTRLELCREAARQGADIVLFGHTHAPTLEYIKKGSAFGVDRDLVLFNPGSLGSFEACFGNLSYSDDEFLLSHGKL